MNPNDERARTRHRDNVFLRCLFTFAAVCMLGFAVASFYAGQPWLGAWELFCMVVCIACAVCIL